LSLILFSVYWHPPPITKASRLKLASRSSLNTEITHGNAEVSIINNRSSL